MWSSCITGRYIRPLNFAHLNLFMDSNLLLSPIDLLPLPLQEQTSLDASKRADFVKKLHAQAKENIEKMTEQYTKRVNKTRKKLVFEQGELVWVHLRKDRFPEERKCKL